MNSHLCSYCNQQIFTYYNSEKNRIEPISKYWKEKSNKIKEMFCSPTCSLKKDQQSPK